MSNDKLRVAVKIRLESGHQKVTESGCWLWNRAVGGKGYGRMSVDGKTLMPHRLSYEIYNGPIPDGMFVCHKCDVPICINPNHLFIGDNTDNMRDMARKGRWVNPQQKLTPDQVIEIYKSKDLHKNIAKEYGIARLQVYRIKNGLRWSSITSAINDDDRPDESERE